VFVPLNYWSDAFSTVWFLINRLPSQTIDMKTPLEHLLHETLNYTFLRYLGVHVGLIFDPITTISLYPLSRWHLINCPLPALCADQFTYIYMLRLCSLIMGRYMMCCSSRSSYAISTWSRGSCWSASAHAWCAWLVRGMMSLGSCSSALVLHPELASLEATSLAEPTLSASTPTPLPLPMHHNAPSPTWWLCDVVGQPLEQAIVPTSTRLHMEHGVAPVAMVTQLRSAFLSPMSIKTSQLPSIQYLNCVTIPSWALHSPLVGCKCIILYVRFTIDGGLHFQYSSATLLYAVSDAD
jgi:hypothetical protein